MLTRLRLLLQSRHRSMAKKATGKTLAIGDVATFEVVTPHCGLDKGYTRKMEVTPELLYCIREGYWKVVKK